ncbi:hypothetical protein BCR37DRAFT_99516 [Protomyces lactucae-debilis]|uniref:Uncharacterized protein n=1 Tax=Protomyces lactucae-debilis TaxID=2754530 RepID=A0A1Y2F523_PROLT|nr:uncharacterized protein BCR37DRAFT_99516 [Protomyces lactucae-debilis]ORY78959.1 hypothetical protein BCR37DRAFT_99516 [Protomyces lactucae-debilis]
MYSSLQTSAATVDKQRARASVKISGAIASSIESAADLLELVFSRVLRQMRSTSIPSRPRDARSFRALKVGFALGFFLRLLSALAAFFQALIAVQTTIAAAHALRLCWIQESLSAFLGATASFRAALVVLAITTVYPPKDLLSL